MAINNLTYDPVQLLSIEAQEDLPANRFINFDGNICGDGDECIGVTEMAWNSGDIASVISMGVAVVEASAGFFPGDSVVADANGKAALQTSSQPIIAKALDSASSGDYMRVIIRH